MKEADQKKPSSSSSRVGRDTSSSCRTKMNGSERDFEEQRTKENKPASPS
jgi:hypothetical protein